MPTIGTTKVEEKELDWAYPVHTLGTSKVADHRGNLFQQFRTKLNKLDRSRITVDDLQPHQHSEAVAKILKGWNGPEPEKLAPYQRLLDLFGALPLRGRLAFQDGQPVGFSIWEETSQAEGLANGYAHIGLHEVPGMSRFVILDMCETLLARGFDRVCIGGSETEGLDQFKRQLRPVESLDLASYDISLKNNPSCGQAARFSHQHDPNKPQYASRTF